MASWAVVTPRDCAIFSSAASRSRLRSEVLGPEPGEPGPRVARPDLAGARGRQQAARQHPVGGHADAELADRRQDLRLDPAAHQRVLDLQRGDRVDGVRAADGGGAHLGQAEVPDEAGLDHLRDRADRVLDRDPRVQPGRLVQVDVVGAEPLQRVGERGLDRGRAGVVPDERAARDRAGRRT